MDRFYELLLREKIPAPMALRAATQWLRSSTASEMRLADWWEAAFRQAGDQKAREEAREKAEDYRLNPDSKPFAAAKYWAAYIFTGPAA